MSVTTRQPSLLALRAFEAAARRQSFTEAARELHVSQAAISRHVRTLEQELGRLLFKRLHRRVELTAPGRRLSAELAAGFSRIHRAVNAVRGVAPRHLRVSVEPAFAASWLVPRLGGFSATFPDVELEIEASDELRAVGRDTDIAIRFLGAGRRRPRQKCRKLFSVEGFPVVAHDHSVVELPRDDAAVLDHRLLHDDDGTAWRTWLAAAGLHGYDRAKHLHLNDSSLVLTAAIREQGVALSAPIYAAADLKAGRLIRLGETIATFGDYWLLEANDRATVKARAAFVSWLDEGLKPSAVASAPAEVRRVQRGFMR